MIKALFIDAGHGLGPTGAIDNGAVGNGTTERREVVEIAQSLCDMLKADPAFTGIQIIKVGVDDRMMLRDHIKQINDLCTENHWTAADTLMVSIHLNAASDPAARGIEAWYSPTEPRMLDFAKLLTEQVSATTGIPLRSKSTLITAENRWGRLGIIDDTIANGCLIEAGFITNEFDAKFFTDNALQAKVVDGLSRAIRMFMAFPPITGTGIPPSFYRDVPVTAWYRGDVELCLREGLFQMPPDGLFHPERPVTRAEVAAILARHLEHHHGMQ